MTRDRRHSYDVTPSAATSGGREREKVPGKRTLTQNLPAPTDAGEHLDAEDLLELRRIAGNRIDRAFTTFGAAVEAVRRDMAAKLAESNLLFDLVLEVVAGRLVPGINAAFGKLAKNLPAKLRDHKGVTTIIAKIESSGAGKKLVDKAVEKGKKLLEKQGRAIQHGATPEDHDKFLDHLIGAAARAAQELDATLADRDADELLAVIAAYDADVVTLEAMRAELQSLLDQFQAQVMPISKQRLTTDHAHEITHTTQAYWIINDSLGTSTSERKDYGDGLRLAILERRALTPREGGTATTLYYFKAWVSEDMRPMAIEKTRAVGGGPDVVHASQLSELRDLWP